MSLITVVEMPAFQVFSGRNLKPDESAALINHLAAHPEAGMLIVGTGGLRKLRWGSGHKGKSGGVRVIYYYHSTEMPLLLLAGFAKNEKDNLTAAERENFRKLLPQLIENYRRKK